MHVVFFDGQCGLCDHVVQWLLKVDKDKIFSFAPLQGKTAARLLTSLPKEYKESDSIILVENYDSDNPKVNIYGKAAFRILWLLGGPWSLLGWISFLPSQLYDWGYWLVAKNRHKIFPEACILPTALKDRFLP